MTRDMTKRIYIAEDETDIRNLIALFLENEGYDVYAFTTGDALLEAFQEQAADLVVLDIMMPGRSGLDICRLLRQQSTVPS